MGVCIEKYPWEEYQPMSFRGEKGGNARQKKGGKEDGQRRKKKRKQEVKV
jgi:hypothetical protein